MTLLTESERELAASAREAGRRVAETVGSEPAPHDAAAEDDQARRALALLSAARLTALAVPDARGSFAVRRICVIREELAYACGLADVMFVMQGLGSALVALAGSEEVKSHYLPGVARGEVIAAFAMTEPEAGSDAASLTTRAVRDGEVYVLDGVKTYITNAGLAGLYTVFARVGGSSSGRDGITAFAVDGSTPGLRLRERLTVSAPHPIGTLELSGCRVPVSCRLGREGEGFDLGLRVLDRFRPSVGAAATGFARRALDESVRHARERRQFGRPLAEFQAIRFKLADMATWVDASRLLVMRAATMLDGGGGATANPAAARCFSAMAKLYATEAAQRTVDEAVQIHGGLGVTRGHAVERLYREVRALRIYEGASEIQRSIIARTLLKETS